jgi:hypothetical protein
LNFGTSFRITGNGSIQAPPVAERPIGSRLRTRGVLLWPCSSSPAPKTNQQSPTGIETDAQSLSASWKAVLKVSCPCCGEVHAISVRETYINGVLQDATAW